MNSGIDFEMSDMLQEALIKSPTQPAPKARHKVARGKRAAKRAAPGSASLKNQSPERAIYETFCSECSCKENSSKTQHFLADHLSPFQHPTRAARIINQKEHSV
jgi:hypothetical protein